MNQDESDTEISQNIIENEKGEECEAEESLKLDDPMELNQEEENNSNADEFDRYLAAQDYEGDVEVNSETGRPPELQKANSTSRAAKEFAMNVGDDLNIQTQSVIDDSKSKNKDESASLEARIERLDMLLKQSDLKDMESGSELHPDTQDILNENDSSSSLSLEERMDRLDKMLSSQLNDPSHDDVEYEYMELKQKSSDNLVDDSNQQGMLPKSKSANEFFNYENSDIHNKTTNYDQYNDEIPWENINRMLESAGFTSVSVNGNVPPEQQTLLERLREVISQYERRGQIIQEMTLDRRRVPQEEDSQVKIMRSQLEELKRELQHLDKENRELKKRSSSSKENGKKKQLELENMKLNQKLKQMEHKIRSNEQVVAKFKAKLQAETERQNQQNKKNKQVFESIEKRLPVPSSTSDQKILGMIDLLEKERKAYKAEIAQLKQQVRELSTTLKEKENWIQHQNHSHISSQDSTSSFRLEEREKNLHNMETAIREKNNSILRKMELLQAKLNSSLKQIEQLEEKNENLNIELRTRPTRTEWMSSQDKITKLERQLNAAAEIIEEAEAKENNIYFHSLNHHKNYEIFEEYRNSKKKQGKNKIMSKSKSVKEQLDRESVGEKDEYYHKKLRDTRSLVEKDRLNHRLKLDQFERLQHHEVINILKSLCRTLTLSDPGLIEPTIEKLVKIVKAMPKLEIFAKQVTKFVANNSSTICSLNNSDPLASVMPQLKRWASDSKCILTYKQLRCEMAALLLEKGVSKSIDISDSELIELVSDLIQFKKRLSQQQQSLGKADLYLGKEPGAIVAQIINHFQQLFDIKEIHGVIPKMNALYVQANETNNFLQILRPMLGLSNKASLHACIAEVERQLLYGNLNSNCEQGTESMHKGNTCNYEPKWS